MPIHTAGSSAHASMSLEWQSSLVMASPGSETRVILVYLFKVIGFSN